MNYRSAHDVQAFIVQGREALITMHRGPDGDAIGSTLALSRLLRAAGMRSTVVAPDAFPDFLKWLPGSADIVVFEQKPAEVKALAAACDVIFCLDFNVPERMGDLQDTIMKAGKPIAVLDHHRFPGDFAQAYYTDDQASSTAELVYRLAMETGLVQHLDADTALCLYTGLVTDTGSFRFSSVNAGVMRMAAALLDTGMDHLQVYNNVFDNNRPEQLRLRGYALSEKLVVTGGGEVAYISLSEQELKRFDYRSGDTEGLVNEALSLRGVHMAGFFYEKDGLVKISLRSKGKVDVNAFARAHFDGGGHIMAAGGRSKAGLQAVVERFEHLVSQPENMGS